MAQLIPGGAHIPQQQPQAFVKYLSQNAAFVVKGLPSGGELVIYASEKRKSRHIRSTNYRPKHFFQSQSRLKNNLVSPNFWLYILSSW